ncbi:retrovirus-related pol polyprotein from transposon TNT 1-94 [Tanacetum coccineum]
MAQSSNEVTLNSSCYSDNAYSLDNDNMQIEYDNLCEISLKIINKNKILKTKRDLLEKEILELNEKIKKLKRSKEIEIACKLCEELKSKNAKLKETQVKFDKSAVGILDLMRQTKAKLPPRAAASISTARHVNTAASKTRDQGFFDSGCSRPMTGNKSYLTDYQEIDGGFVAFVGSPKEKNYKKCYWMKVKVLLKVPDQKQHVFDLKNVFLQEMKGIKREFSVARTPQQNGVAKRKNRILIEAAKTMLADSLLPTTFWAEAVNTACYVQNRVLVTKPHNKTPYELVLGRPPSISFMRPFGCSVTILNTLYPLGKFDRKADEGFLVGYSINSKAFRVFNSRTRKVEENMHINFLENKPNVAGSGPEWLFDIDSLTKSMNYEPVTAGNQTNGNEGIETNVNAGQAGQEKASDHEYILLPLMLSNSPLSSSTQSTDDKDADEDRQRR